ncbi:MAG TPA: serine/threonine-protein kinase [Polyangiaceae bacterium]|nr:serine/threonine-protein kinase [Polyangiaceae bacterium]
MGIDPGTIIGGKYSVSQRLGVGGMGEVWAGASLHDGSPVAVKIMLPAASLTREVWARFKREALVLGRIQSEYVARVLDFLSDREHGLALVMELIPGQPFSAILAVEGRISVEAMTLIAIDVTRGLADLHEAQIVHRDMKPGNIVLNPRPGERDRAMIIDFGVSRILSAPGEEEVTAITRDDRVLGTLEYMAPEQVLGSRSVTPVADLYAMGAMMYRAVAGRHVFGDLVEGKLVAAKLNQDAPALDTGRKDPAALRFAAMVNKLLSRRPKERFQTAEDLLLELETIEELLFQPVTMPLIHVQFEEEQPPSDDVFDDLPTTAMSPEQRAQVMLRHAKALADQRKSALVGILAPKEPSVSGATTQRLSGGPDVESVSVSITDADSLDSEEQALAFPTAAHPAPAPQPVSPSPATPSQGYAAAAVGVSRDAASLSHAPPAPESFPQPARGGHLSAGMLAVIGLLIAIAAAAGGVVGASFASRRAATSPQPSALPPPAVAATAAPDPSPSQADSLASAQIPPSAEPPASGSPASDGKLRPATAGVATSNIATPPPPKPTAARQAASPAAAPKPAHPVTAVPSVTASPTTRETATPEAPTATAPTSKPMLPDQP